MKRGKILWKACSYLLEEDEELFKMVRVELEPAIKLSREIIKELQDSNKELRREKEDSCRRLIEIAIKDGKGDGKD